jgi:oxidoreductase
MSFASSAPASALSVIVAGSTGAVGRNVVVNAVASPSIRRVVALSRRAIPAAEWPATFPGIDGTLAAQKLNVVAVDWEKLYQAQQQQQAAAATAPAVDATLAAAFAGHHHAVMAMGTTRRDAGSAEAFFHIDHDYALSFATLVKAASGSTLEHYSQISSQGADSSSWFLYMSTKGKTDDAVCAMKFPRTSIFRPGLLGRGDDKARFVERFASFFAPVMDTATLGAAVVKDFLQSRKSAAAQVSFWNNDDINRIAAPPADGVKSGCCS